MSRKLLSWILILSMIFSLCSVPAFAEAENGEGEEIENVLSNDGENVSENEDEDVSPSGEGEDSSDDDVSSVEGETPVDGGNQEPIPPEDDTQAVEEEQSGQEEGSVPEAESDPDTEAESEGMPAELRAQMPVSASEQEEEFSAEDDLADRSVHSGTCGANGDNLTWTLDGNGVLTISGTGAMASYHDSNAPWFSLRDSVLAVVLEDGVSSIGDSAFYSCALSSVSIPNSVTVIEDWAFDNCVNLTGLTIPSSVTSLGNGVFFDCRGLISMTFPSSVTSIGGWMFEQCYALTNVTIPVSVTSIGEAAFQYCTALTTVYYEGSEEQKASLKIGANNDQLSEATWVCNYSTTPTVEPSGTCGANGDNLTWVLDGNGVLTISGTGAMADYNDASDVPWHAYVDEIFSITVTDGVTSIGESAFEDCCNAGSLSIASSVSRIGPYAFAFCNALTTVSLPPALTEIADGTFYECSGLSSVTISANVTSIGGSAFYDCTNLTGVTIPASVTSISPRAFSGCTSIGAFTVEPGSSSFATDGYGVLFSSDMSTIVCVPSRIANGYVIPSSVTSIGVFAFDSCTGILSISIPSSVSSIGTGAFWGCSGLTGKFTFPGNITKVDDVVFYGCSSLISVEFAEGVKTVGAFTFQDCTSLTSVTLPESLTTINMSAFTGCRSLSNVYFAGSETMRNERENNGWWLNGNEKLFDAAWTYGKQELSGGYFGAEGDNLHWSLDDAGNMVVSGSGAMEDFESGGSPWFSYKSSVKNLVIEDGITNIGAYAFYNLYYMTSVSIPESVTDIGQWAFRLCSNLQSVEIPSGLTSIACGAFFSCDLPSVTIPDGVTSIGEHAFEFNAHLRIVTIPASVTSIADGAFMGSTNISNVYYGGTRRQWNAISIGQNNEGLTSAAIEFDPQPVEQGNCGKNGDNLTWALYADGELVISGSGDMANYYSSAPWTSYLINYISLPAGLTSVGDYAFSNCVNLTELTVPNGVTYIGTEAFSGCTNLAALTLPCSANIGFAAGKNCASLTTLHLTAGTGTMYGNNDVERLLSTGRNTLTTLVLDNGITEIEGYAFRNCACLNSVTLPDTLTVIGRSAFVGCSSLREIILPEGLLTIGDSAFQQCGITSVTLPESLTSIERSAFNSCSRLASVTIPSSSRVTIGDWAFQNCNSLTSIDIPTYVKLGAGTFSYCQSLSTITISDSHPQYMVQNNVLYTLGKSSLVCVPGAYAGKLVLTTATARIADYACAGCTGLTEIEMNNVTAIGSYAFSGCTGLKRVRMNMSSVPSIASDSFRSVTCDVHFLPDYAANYPESGNYGGTLTWIASNGFLGDDMYWALDNGVLSVNGTGVIPGGWNKYDSCPRVPWVNDRSRITSIVIGDGVTGIGDFAFDGCSKAQTVTLPDGLETIGASVFGGCSSLIEINLPSSLSSIGSSAFYGCSSLESITIPSNVSNLGYKDTFRNCTSLISIEIPEGISLIGTDAFNNCSSLQSVSLPSTLTSIGSGAFYVCKSLQNVIYAGTRARRMELEGNGWETSGNDRLFNANWTYAPHDHVWSEVSYVWSDDNSAVTASRSCSVCDDVETETVAATGVVTTEPTCTTAGVKTFTSEAFTNTAFTVQTTTEAIDPLGHAWGEPTYVWSDNNSAVTASRSCSVCDDVETETVAATGVVTTEPTCTTAGEKTFTSEAFTNTAFTVQTTTEATDPLGHAWGEPTYVWSDDNGSVTATRVCANDASHVETETAASAYSVKTEPTCASEGVGTYTASFGNEAFAAQTKDVPIPPIEHAWSDPVFLWAADHGSATARRECSSVEPHHFEEAEAAVTHAITQKPSYLSNGIIEYTATVEFDGVVRSDTESVEIPNDNWQVVDGKVYYTDVSGKHVTGWQRIFDDWYYFDSNGVMTAGWKQLGGKWYYFNTVGVMQTGLQQIGVKTYFFNDNGTMFTGWKQVDGVWYYFLDNGAAATGWKQVGSKWYYFGEDGAMYTGLQTVGTKKYFFLDNGSMFTGWKEIGGVWYYFLDNGAAATGWKQVGSKWYYFGEDGAMYTGLQMIGEKKYFFLDNGSMVTGWKQIDGTWYYFLDNGAACIGWKKLGSSWYYFDSDGSMLANTSRTIGSKVYYFSENGVCLNP